MNAVIAGRVAAFVSRLDWSGWSPAVRAHVGEAHALLVVEWSEGEVTTKLEVPLLVVEADRMWCAVLHRALVDHGAPGSATFDGRSLVAEPTLVPWGEA